MRHTVSIFVLISFIWLINSGHYNPLLLSLGLVSVFFVVWLAHKMDMVDEESQPIHLSLKLPAYYWWLFVKIVRANINVVMHVWRPKLAISPTVDTITSSQVTDMGRVIYANSITLTPGTVSLDLDGNTIRVHSLTAEGLAELKGGEMDKRVTALE